MNIIVSSNTSWSILKFRLELIEALKYKHNLYVVSGSDEYDDELLIWAQRMKIEVLILKLNTRGHGLKEDFINYIKLTKFIKKNNINTVLSFTLKMNFYFCLCRLVRPIKFIPTLNGGYLFRDDNQSNLEKYKKWILVFLIEMTSKIIFVQKQSDKDLIQKLLGKSVNKIQVINGSGLTKEEFKKIPNMNTCNHTPIRFGFVGRLHPQKGIFDFITLAESFQKLGYPNKFFIFGVTGPWTTADVDVALKNVTENCTITLNEGDRRLIYDMFDVLIFNSSYAEGVPRTILEAAAKGKTVISKDAPYSNGLIKDGETGYIIKGDLCAYVEQFLVDVDLQRAKTLQSLVKEKYSFETVLNGYKKAIEDA